MEWWRFIQTIIASIGGTGVAITIFFKLFSKHQDLYINKKLEDYKSILEKKSYANKVVFDKEFVMYQLFNLEGRNFNIQGYHYPCENAEKVVVLIHGIGEHAGRYARMAEYFEKEKIAIVSMDLRGHGRSGGKRGHCAPREDVLADIDALICHAQELYPGVPVVMYGHSMGGNITLDYRARGGKNDTPCGYIISAPWIRLCAPGGEVLAKVLVPLSKIAPEFTITQKIGEETLGNLRNRR